MMAQPQFQPAKTDTILFDGGLDVETPALQIKAAFLRNAQNYECGISGGYRRINGYERFDGQASPSDAAYYVLNATITGSYVVGDTLTGATSGATGVIADATASYFVLTQVAGTFQDAENLQISAVTVAVASGTATVDGASTSKLHAQYKNAAADIYRADIAAVPGSGSILGVVRYNDVLYAFRNNAGGTAAAIYKSSASGWTAVTLYYELSFTAGSGSAPAEGATITQGAVSSVVKRVVLQSGTWAGGTAAGRFIVAAPTGGSFVAGAFTAGVTATCSGAETQITLQPSGRYEFDIKNIGGALGTRRIYGADGANRGFEFDGDVYVPITTGMTTDTPGHVAVHKKHLFFMFGTSVQHSGIGKPYEWSPITGAAEIGIGDTGTGFVSQPGNETSGGALAILSRNHIDVLYGSSSADWNLSPYGDEQGGREYSMQKVGNMTLMLDDRGISSLATSTNYGNFQSSALSNRITSWLTERRTKFVASSISRDRNQYRLFFSDKSALYMTFEGNKLRGCMPMLFSHAVACMWSGEDTSGDEEIYFGSTDGYVYQMEKGTSHDGSAIDAYIWLAFNASRAERVIKRYKRVMFEIAGEGYAEHSFRYELGYNSSDITQPAAKDVLLDLSAQPYWDSFVWDDFVWDGVSLQPESMSLEGSANNISLILQSNSDYFAPTTFNGAIIHYAPRRALR
jgi:hypothetical protein